MSNRKLNLGSRLQGSEPFLEIQSVNTDNFVFDANSTLNLADSLSVQDLTINGTFTNAGGGAINAPTATYSTSITTPKIIFTDNNSTGLTIESSDGADFITCDSTNGSEHIDILKDMNTGGNKVTHGTNGSRGIIQYADIRNSTIGDTNTLSANTTGTSASWASSRTISFRNSANGNAAMGSVAINGTGDVNADVDILDQTNSSAHKFIIANTETGHTSTSLQQRIDFINAQDSSITRSDNLVGKIVSQNDNMSFIVYDKSHSSNSSTLQLTKNNADDIPTINSFLHFNTKSDATRVMNIENNDTTYDTSEAQKTRATAIHLGNNGNYSDSVVGNTIAKIEANWRDDGQGQLQILARQTNSGSANESGLLISDNTGGGTALDVPLSASEMVIKGIKVDGIKDIDYFNGLKVGHGSMLGNGLQLLSSGGAVISGSPSGYDNVINLKLKSGGGLTADGDGLYATASPEWVGSGSSPEKILAENKRVVANAGDNTTFDFNYGGTERNGCNSYHILGTSKSDASNPVNAGLQIFSNNESDGGDGATSSLMLRTRTENDGDDAVKTDVSVMLTNNNGEIALASSHFSAADDNTTGGTFGGIDLTNRSSAIHHDRMLFGKNGGIIITPQAKTANDNSIDDVYAQFRDNYALQGTGLGELSIYNGSVGAGINLLSGTSNLTSGTDLGGTPISVPNGFNITYSTGGVATFNNKKTKQIVFKVASVEKVRIHSNGFMGIGRAAPECPLSVTGTGVISPTGVIVTSSSNWGYWVSTTSASLNSPAVFGGGASNTPNLSLSAAFSGSIASLAFHTASDSRIKTDVSECDVSACYDKFNQLELKEYHYIDPATRKENKTIGYIAQEVDSVDSGFVNKTHKPIPNEMRNILDPVWEDNKLMLDLSFNDNETGICVFWVSNSDVIAEYEREVKYEDGGFVFDKQWERIFFYGREVNDFNSVKKDSIMALLHGAVKYIDNDVRVLETHDTSHNNNITELQNKVNLLETENNGLLERTQVLEDKNVEQDTKINTLETLLQELTARVSFNETALKGLIN